MVFSIAIDTSIIVFALFAGIVAFETQESHIIGIVPRRANIIAEFSCRQKVIKSFGADSQFEDPIAED